ncbi:MAG: hypothetical protein N3B10_11190, partial [Armatimonadetes bacterium]|nr:hypothetical protein [Armatimonadota bacterium]
PSKDGAQKFVSDCGLKPIAWLLKSVHQQHFSTHSEFSANRRTGERAHIKGRAGFYIQPTISSEQYKTVPCKQQFFGISNAFALIEIR